MTNQNDNPNDFKSDLYLTLIKSDLWFRLIKHPKLDEWALPIEENGLQNNFSKIKKFLDQNVGEIPIIENGEIKTHLKVIKHQAKDEWLLPVTGDFLSVLTNNQIKELDLKEYKEKYFSKRKNLCITATFSEPIQHPQGGDKWAVRIPEEFVSNLTNLQKENFIPKETVSSEELISKGWDILSFDEEVCPIYQRKYIDAGKAFEIEKRLKGLIYDWKTGYNYFCIEMYLRTKLSSSLNKLFALTMRLFGKNLFSNNHLHKFIWNQVLAYEELVFVYLGRIFDSHGKVDSLEKLLNYFQSHPNDFMFATHDKINDLVRKDKNLLEEDGEIRKIIEKIRTLRDVYIAHSDKSFREIDRVHSEINISHSEIFQIFRFIHSILNKYSLCFNNQEVAKENQNHKIYKMFFDSLIRVK